MQDGFFDLGFGDASALDLKLRMFIVADHLK
jgi:hypothetical protein